MNEATGPRGRKARTVTAAAGTEEQVAQQEPSGAIQTQLVQEVTEQVLKTIKEQSQEGQSGEKRGRERERTRKQKKNEHSPHQVWNRKHVRMKVSPTAIQIRVHQAMIVILLISRSCPPLSHLKWTVSLRTKYGKTSMFILQNYCLRMNFFMIDQYNCKAWANRNLSSYPPSQNLL